MKTIREHLQCTVATSTAIS